MGGLTFVHGYREACVERMQKDDNKYSDDDNSLPDSIQLGVRMYRRHLDQVRNPTPQIPVLRSHN